MDKCEICGKEFKNKGGLNMHMRTHEPKPTGIGNPFVSAEWKSRKCPICNQDMVYKKGIKGLEEHLDGIYNTLAWMKGYMHTHPELSEKGK